MQKPTAKPVAAMPASVIDQKKQHLLVEAAGEGKIGEVKRLLRFKPMVNINSTSDQTFETPIEAAVKKGKHAMVEYLLNEGANPNEITHGGLQPGLTLLMEAAANKDIKMIELLLAYGADPREKYRAPGRPRGNPRSVASFIHTDATPEQRRQIEEILGGKSKIR